MKKVKKVLDKLNEPYFDDTNSNYGNSSSPMIDIVFGVLLLIFVFALLYAGYVITR